MTYLPQDFFENLEAIYSNKASLKPYWDTEAPILRSLMPAVAERLAFNYRLVRPLNVGGSGIVAVIHDVNLDADRALKVSRPSPGKDRILARVLQTETETLLRLSHPNLIRVFAQGSVSVDSRDYPFYVMDYLHGAEDSDQFLRAHGTDRHVVLSLLRGLLKAVEYLHAHSTVHLDIKPQNLLVSPSGQPVLSDLGFAKQLKLEDGYTLIGGTDGYIHPDARALVQEIASDPNRLQGQALRRALRPEWDLFSLGKTFLALLHELDTHHPTALRPYDKRYLKLMACRLLQGLNGPHERALGLTLSTFAEISYTSVTQARVDLEKLTGEYNLEARVPELNLLTQETIQVSTLPSTPFTKRVKALVETTSFRRLATFSQLGLLNLVYPTATHTRFEHVLGTYSVACRYVLALYSDPLNPLFRQIMGEEDLRAGLLAALLHDLGHFPLSHDLEEADQQTFSHETFTLGLLKAEVSDIRAVIEPPLSDTTWGVSMNRLVAVLSADPKLRRGELRDRILKTLVDGPIDVDKVDYLQRDAANLGLSYGGAIDLDRLLRCLTVIVREEENETHVAIGIHEKGKIPAESIAFVRYCMFGQVYWHHAYRAIKAMIQRLVWEALRRSGSKDKRASLREECRKLFLTADSTPPAQVPLFELAPASSVQPTACALQGGDERVLRWLSERAGDVGTEFVSLLASRVLFKRVLVLKRDREKDKALWDAAYSYWRSSRRNWEGKLRMQQLFQDEVVSYVAGGGKPADSSLISADDRNRFLSHAANRGVLLLIDVATERKGGSLPLEFIVEEDRRKVRQDEMRTGSFETSLVWSALQRSFQESIGKLRVFCHPSHASFVNAAVPRDILEQALQHALARVDESD